jgi:hypothetical protein
MRMKRVIAAPKLRYQGGDQAHKLPTFDGVIARSMARRINGLYSLADDADDRPIIRDQKRVMRQAQADTLANLRKPLR